MSKKHFIALADAMRELKPPSFEETRHWVEHGASARIPPVSVAGHMRRAGGLLRVTNRGIQTLPLAGLHQRRVRAQR